MKNNKNGITLIALVLTIIVLLILAGVSIAMLSGENGILKQATNAKEMTTKAEEKEIIKLAINEAFINHSNLTQNSLQEVLDNESENNEILVTYNLDNTLSVFFTESLRNYKVYNNIVECDIDFKEAFKNEVAPETQDEERNNNVIGIGTDGKAVDMDLWNYCKIDNGYALNTKEIYDTASGNDRKAGYLGNYTDKGEIIGTMPQYISENGGNNFYPVINIGNTFFNEDELKVEPKIPVTVSKMKCTFSGCNINKVTNIPPRCEEIRWSFEKNNQLTEVIEIPNDVVSLYGAFSRCVLLKKVPLLPEKLENLQQTFAYCSNLEEIRNIPNSVTNMNQTFYNCSSLGKIEITIPENVTDIRQTFGFCPNLEGEITVNCNPKNYTNFLQNTTKPIILKGNSTMLNKIGEGRSNVTVIDE